MFTKFSKDIRSDLFKTKSDELQDKETLRQLTEANGGNAFRDEQLTAIRFPMQTHLRIIAGAGAAKRKRFVSKLPTSYWNKELIQRRS